ncbi:Nn.00g015800.m01.CDS01 [Neocucurbitaria sp. VM-36]
MVLALALKAELNGVTDLRPQDTEDAPFYYTFKVQCTSCRETHPNFVSVSRFEQNEMSGSRGEANFVWKCKNSNIKAAPATYEQTDPPKMVNILEFDCRGLEFTEFKADGEFLATGAESGTKFSGIELYEGEWFDYDEKAGEEVSITGIQWEIRRA